MLLRVVLAAFVAVGCVTAEEERTGEQRVSRERRSSEGYGYQQQSHYKPAGKKCYQCAYSPPKHVYEKFQSYGNQGGYGGGNGGHGGGNQGGHGDGNQGGYGGNSYGSHEESRPATLNGGWDKCLGPFDHYQAKAYGVDVWDCHYNNCYIRFDHNGDVFRGCYKGEYGVDQNLLGCHYQGGSTYCFCEGELCNNGPASQH